MRTTDTYKESKHGKGSKECWELANKLLERMGLGMRWSSLFDINDMAKHLQTITIFLPFSQPFVFVHH